MTRLDDETRELWRTIENAYTAGNSFTVDESDLLGFVFDCLEHIGWAWPNERLGGDFVHFLPNDGAPPPPREGLRRAFAFRVPSPRETSQPNDDFEPDALGAHPDPETTLGG